jgi:hypothetical protein
MGLMHLTLRLALVAGLFLVSADGFAQKNADKGCKPPIRRQLFHDYIDREQKNALKADGKSDAVFYVSKDEDVNFLVTQAITTHVDAIQCEIERDTSSSDQKKVSYLRGIERTLRNFTSLYRSRKINASNIPAVIDAYQMAMKLDKVSSSIEPVIEKSGYDVGNMLVASGAFDNNAGFRNSRNIVLRKYMALHPEMILPTLKNNPDFPYRDSLIILAAYKFPRQLYDYAAASNRLSYAIRAIDDPLIKTVSKMATSKGSGQLYFPFLDNIIRGKQTMEDIDAVKNDPVKYYKLLVKTRIDYINRIVLEKDSIREMRSLEVFLGNKAKQVFIQAINGLHESPDAIRFKILNQLNAQELYYLAVFGEDELYTSSFVKGVYPLMMQKMDNRGDSLLMSVSFDRFKKFIKMSAGYNTLSNFLSSFPDQLQAEKLMTAFVNGLEKTTTLEDGVDVADSYASIEESIKPLAEKMLANVKANYDKNIAANNHRGIIIYNLLYKLFESADSSNKTINLSEEFGIPPVYNINYQSLANENGQVTMQVFFYGDKDGQMNYNGFLSQLKSGGWKKIEDTKNWIAFASTKGKLVVYANKWIDDEKQPGDIEKAQTALTNYLSEKDMLPSIVVHRGHSYWVSGTIEKITPAAKIVLLGSCGGYNVIHDVLKHSPDAHIIASKQTGKIYINQPFMNLLDEKLINGNNIDWIPFWGEFKNKAGKIEGFDDYIPPYKNLGALFIKAYNSQMGITEMD